MVNEQGEIVLFDLTSGNVHDTHLLDQVEGWLFGKLIGDKGYLSQPKTTSLADKGIELITSTRRNMKQLLISLENKVLLRKQGIVESVNNLLKHWAQIDHTRPRNPNNFFVNLIAGLIAYCWKPRKPTICIDEQELALLQQPPTLP